MKLKKLFTNYYNISLLKKVNVILFGVLSTALLNRYLGPENKGVYATLLSVVSIITVACNLGTNLSYPHFKRKNEKKYLPIFFALSTSLFILLISIGIITFFIMDNINFSLIVILSALSIYRLQLNYYNLVENFIKHSIVYVISACINFLVLLSLYFVSNTNIYYAYFAYALKDLVIIIGSLISLKLKPTLESFNFSIWIEVIKFGLIPVYTTLLITINYQIDVLLLNSLQIQMVNIGLYTVGVSLAEYGWLIPDIFKDVMINKNARKDDLQGLAFSLRMSSTVMFGVYLFLFLFGELVLRILFGSDFIGSYSVTLIIFIGIYSMIYCKIIGTLYIAKGEWRFYAIVLTLSVVSNTLLNLITIPLLDIEGAAIASVFSYSLAGFAFLRDFRNKYDFSYRELMIVNKQDFRKIISIFR